MQKPERFALKQELLLQAIDNARGILRSSPNDQKFLFILNDSLKKYQKIVDDALKLYGESGPCNLIDLGMYRTFAARFKTHYGNRLGETMDPKYYYLFLSKPYADAKQWLADHEHLPLGDD